MNANSFLLSITVWLIMAVFGASSSLVEDTSKESLLPLPSSSHLRKRAVQHHYQQRRDQQNRIVGGSAAPDNEYPFHIQWKLGCGGTRTLAE